MTDCKGVAQQEKLPWRFFPYSAAGALAALASRSRMAYTSRMAKTSKSPRRFILRWLPVAAWLSFTFVMSTGTFSAENTYSVIGPMLAFLFPRLTPDRIAALHGIVRKGAHVFEYFVLGLLLLNAFHPGPRGAWKWRWPFFALMGVFLWALGDEFHQSFVPDRTAAMADVAIDTAGGAMAQFVAAFWHLSLGRRAAAPRDPLRDLSAQKDSPAS